MDAEWLGEVRAEAFLEGERRRLAEGRARAVAASLVDTSISVGVAMPVPEGLRALAGGRGIPVLRRSSGGTALLHRRGDLLWSVVLPREDPRVGRSYVRGYGRLGAPLVGALADHGIEADWGEALALSDSFCLFGPRGQVLRSADRALGGAAQHLSAGHLLHHGVVNGSVDRQSLEDLFGVAREHLRDRLTGLDELAPRVRGVDVGRSLVRRWAEGA